MIELKITNKFSEEENWSAQLKEWCVAHKLIIDTSLSEPELFEKDKRYKGIEAIEKFLKEYKSFMDEWYDCRCDRWLDYD